MPKLSINKAEYNILEDALFARGYEMGIDARGNKTYGKKKFEQMKKDNEELLGKLLKFHKKFEK